MPSSPPPVRPVLAALLTVLLLVVPALASAPATPWPGNAAHAAGAPAAPPQPPEDVPISMDLVSLDPASLTPGGTVTAQVEVTNTSAHALEAPALELRTRTSRVTDRDTIAQWQSDASADTSTPAIAASEPAPVLAPGDSVTLSVRATAEELGYVDAPYYWGTRRVSLTVVSGEEPLAAIRSFVVWRPETADESITQSVLLPVTSRDVAGAVTDPAAYTESITSGRLADQLQLALRDDVDWWLDPVLLDPPMLPQDDGEAEPSDVAGTPVAETPQPAIAYQPDAPATEMAAALDEGVGERTVLGMPYARTDLVALDAAGATELAGAVREQGTITWEQADVVPRATALSIPAEQVDAASLTALREAGATAAIVPSSSLRADPSGTVTPSSFAVHPGAGGQDPMPVLAPDPELSAEFSLLTPGGDAEQTRQRLLAETATIASEFTTAPRHLLIAPDPEADLDAAAAGAALDALAEAPWIETGRTGTLLSAASQQNWATDPQSEDGRLYALGEVGDGELLPSGPDETGQYVHLDQAEEPQLTDAQVLGDLEETWGRLDLLESVMNDDAPLDAPRRMALSGASERWRGDAEIPAARADLAAESAAALHGAIEVEPASGYNLISDAAPVPITITNGLDTRITVRIEVTSDRPLVQIDEQPVVEVPARGQVETTVPVTAVANGTVTLTTTLSTEEGRTLTEPVEVPLTVNPAWENWTTLLVVIAMSALVIVGVARARRTGAATRAPAIRGPEDPEELSRTGRSAPLQEPAADPGERQGSAASADADDGDRTGGRHRPENTGRTETTQKPDDPEERT